MRLTCLSARSDEKLAVRVKIDTSTAGHERRHVSVHGVSARIDFSRALNELLLTSARTMRRESTVGTGTVIHNDRGLR